ncbi:hypothetical protein AALP_AA3G011500 [Arabis alpina]|uniref:Translocon-associated protein subunit beta n=1 Tax=Arabis alpina TaxID=50452 RepID=A0A087H6A4_ARAAL|nr:hypothetical protein AALP_AA3G011500 [Arabis alpina]
MISNLRTAYDVTLTDGSWDKDTFQSFELVAKVKGIVYGAPALVTFRIPTKTALQQTYSTPILPLDIFAERPPTHKLDLRLVAKYGSLVSVVSCVALFIYLIATPSKSNASSKKKR